MHYLGSKSVTIYLQTTTDRATVYWRQEVPRMDLREGDIVPLPEPSEYVYPYPEDPYLVGANVDVALHATCLKTRCSTGGHLISYDQLDGEASTYYSRNIVH